jgi:hypothetical protein
VKDGWQWPSVMPGISVMPRPSTVRDASSRAIWPEPPCATFLTRLPWTRTSPRKLSLPVPSNTLTFVNRMAPTLFAP